MPLSRVRMLLFAAAFLMGGFAGGLRGQSPPAAAPDVPPVRLDVVVTDAKGRAVTNLKPADFELLENGTARTVSALELRTLPAEPGDVSPIQTPEDEARAARQPGTRVFGFYLDEFHVTAGPSADRARLAIQRFVEATLRPQDLAFVMRPLDSLNAIRFTRDRALLHRGIDAFTGRKGDYTPRTRFEELYIGRAPGAVASARRQIVVSGLREMIMRLGELGADRAAIVLVSEGFPRDALAPVRALRFPGFDGLARASSRFHVPMYTFNPSVGGGEPPPTDRDRSNEMLQWLADQTGGRSISAAAETAGFDRVRDDLETYYALTYQPASADGRFHGLEIRVRRSGVSVQARKGYWSPLGSESRPLVANTSKILSPFSTRPLRKSNMIETWIGLVPQANGRTRMVIAWERRTRGVNAPEVVALKAQTTGGQVLFDGRIGPAGSESALPADSARFEVPAGRIELDMSIYDMEGKAIDTEVRDYDVPDFGAQKRGPMLFAPEVVRARTLRDFTSATTNPDAAPSSARTFTRADRLLIRVPAYDASGAAVAVTAKVLNAWGQPMRDIDAIAATPRDGLAQFALPLSWLVPGQYQIELQGNNANGAVKERVSFRVTG